MEQPISNEPFLMPGPQFNQSQKSSWLERHSQKLILGIIIVLIALGAFSFYESYQNRQELLKTALNGSPSLSSSPSPTPSLKTEIEVKNSPKITASENPKPKITERNPAVIASNPETKVSVSSLGEVKAENGQFIARAAKGNGTTHLARAALKEYAKDKEIKKELSAEQKIFIEDYLRKNIEAPRPLLVGDEISFSEDLIKEAVQAAQALSPSQIQNLSQYVPLVPSI